MNLLRRHSPGSSATALAARTAPLFQESVAASGIAFDDAQLGAVAAITESTRTGIYLHGTTGRGKTDLATRYFDAIPGENNVRMHFHGFLDDVQARIAHERISHRDAIRSIIGTAPAVFFDEFHVHDVADAIYLTELLRTLCDGRTLVVATSNYAPADLMPNPLFHHRFLTAIDIITRSLTVVPIGDGPDYRTRVTHTDNGFASGYWLSPLARQNSSERIPLHSDGIACHATHTESRTATFTFTEICERPIGTRQYLWLAHHFNAITIVEVPDLATADRDALMRLTNLIDVLYDRDIRVDVHAAGPPDRLLDAQPPPLDAARTVSRLATLRAIG
ncbi:cell division protein ZapE [Gordonia amarae]|uniref:ATPase n=2 Tax=Gordonia amarae TaxID=36821 RepID=G7GPU8_9ACTN|nr:cell division protein ZapE [Gordonia amarae]QHN18087.1 cell division protein ZapE [Gordonia amarae]QHN22608.1 cell division protein ZapE [Gordonia amarae]QHN31474.1 cell division protein ZapE [Gordonia amarae]QHN40218.1 cell division protein ZapE [Gordonia amarae]GAB05623.1 hypothetical protein GOAMR_40_01130 [Gordonia amarae NBRC 15530]